jgi:hypothetical protein
LLSIPIGLIYWDILKTLDRYGLRAGDNLPSQKGKAYEDAAQRVFKENPDVDIFVFGHTHDALLNKKGNKVMINTGTWLKKLTRIPARFRLLPDVYYPSFLLNYFLVRQEGERTVIEYKRIPKEIDPELTLLQRLAIIRKHPGENVTIPARIHL